MPRWAAARTVLVDGNQADCSFRTRIKEDGSGGDIFFMLVGGSLFCVISIESCFVVSLAPIIFYRGYFSQLSAE